MTDASFRRSIQVRVIRKDRSRKLVEEVKGEPDEPKRSGAPRKRGLGRGLGAILSAPASAGTSDAYDEHLTLHDPLTGLPNRTLLDDRLEEALAACRQDGASLAVLVVALDGFSKVNELFGHRVGDGLLHDVAVRMSATRRRSDTVARFAGDEFVVVCPYVGSADLACRMATRILEDVGRPASFDGVEHRLSASIGIVVAEPGADGVGDADADADVDAADHDRSLVEMLLGDATLAMRRAKDEGGGSWRLFDASMKEDVEARQQYRQDLRNAIEDGNLFLDYEPVVHVESGTTVGDSALLAWRLPGSVVEGPEALLELVDEAGLAAPVGRWLFDQALSDLGARRSESVLPEDYRVWVKVSPLFLMDPSIVEIVDELTAKHRLPSSMIGLDISEPPQSGLVAIDPILQALVVRDVALALDNFGARSSNLTLLQRLPISALKLASEVVASLDDGDGQEGAALVRGLVGLGRALGLAVMAQGVVSETQLAALRALGCEFAQGPHLAGGGESEPLWATGPGLGAVWASDLVARLAGPIGPGHMAGTDWSSGSGSVPSPLSHPSGAHVPVPNDPEIRPGAPARTAPPGAPGRTAPPTPSTGSRSAQGSELEAGGTLPGNSGGPGTNGDSGGTGGRVRPMPIGAAHTEPSVAGAGSRVRGVVATPEVEDDGSSRSVLPPPPPPHLRDVGIAGSTPVAVHPGFSVPTPPPAPGRDSRPASAAVPELEVPEGPRPGDEADSEDS